MPFVNLTEFFLADICDSSFNSKAMKRPSLRYF